MATPYIGSNPFIEFDGALPMPIAPTVLEITRENANGHAFVKVGSRAAKTTIRTMVDTADAAALALVHQALQGTLVTVVNPDGSSISNVMVESCKKLKVEASLKAVGGISGGAWLLSSEWVLQPT